MMKKVLLILIVCMAYTASTFAYNHYNEGHAISSGIYAKSYGGIAGAWICLEASGAGNSYAELFGSSGYIGVKSSPYVGNVTCRQIIFYLTANGIGASSSYWLLC